MLASLLALPLMGTILKLLTAAVQVVVPLLVAVGDFAIWFVKQFFNGLKAIFDNLSVLAVIAVVIVGSGWYFKTWDNDKVLKQCLETPVKKLDTKKYVHPIKRKLPSVIYKQPTTSPQQSRPSPSRSFNPFEGN